MNELLKLSKSGINQFFDCPFVYKKERIEHLPAIKGAPLQRGSAVHDVIGAYAAHCVKENVKTDIAIIPDLLHRILDPLRIPAEVHAEAREIVEEFASCTMFVPGRIIAVEDLLSDKPLLSVQIGNYLYRGRLDMAEFEDSTDTLIVEDYKTNRQIASQKQVEYDLSLPGYALLAIANIPRAAKTKHVVMRLTFVRFGQTVEYECEVADLELARRRIIRAGDLISTAIAKDDFPATPGDLCDHCPYSNLCPHESREIPRSDNLESIVSLAEDVLVMERKIADRNAAIKKWCAEQGTVKVNGVEFGHFVEAKNSWNKVELIEFLQGQDASAEYLAKYLNANATALRTWREQLIDEGALVPAKATKFKHKKDKDAKGGKKL
jgi:hypothetical protein